MTFYNQLIPIIIASIAIIYLISNKFSPLVGEIQCFCCIVSNPIPALSAGGVQAPVLHLHEGWGAESVEGQLCHHGESHALCRHPVLLPRAVQEAAGRLLWLPGQVSTVWLLFLMPVCGQCWSRWTWMIQNSGLCLCLSHPDKC